MPGKSYEVYVQKGTPLWKVIEDKVNRCVARYSPRATTTSLPTNRAPNESARPGPK